MKRIDDKINEIEKKDKRNRLAYYIIIIILIAFFFYANFMGKKVTKLEIEKSETYKELESTYKKLDTTYSALKNSLEPEEYWNHVAKDNSVEDYINFITNDWGIDKTEYIDTAIENLKLENSNKPVGFDGWLFVGTKNNTGDYTSGNNVGKKTIRIIYRLNKETKTNIIDSLPALKDSEPQIGDIVRLVGVTNYVTYKYKSRVGDKSNNGAYMNEQGFRNRTKAIIVDTYKNPDKTNYNVKIKYY